VVCGRANVLPLVHVHHRVDALERRDVIHAEGLWLICYPN
jgi:hypothetical protein